jgi:hypothetical protein
MLSGRSLVNRIRARLGRPESAGGIGMAFTPAMAEDWRALEEEVDAALKRAGSAFVSSWEVGAAELGRVVLGREGERALLERYSDAAVPALTPFQDLHKGCAGAMAEGAKAGLAKGDLGAATLPLVRMLHGLDARAEAGWGKTVAYLEPLYAVARPGAREDLAGGAAPLAQACRNADAVLRDSLSKLPQAASLGDGVIDAFDAWQRAITREIEIIVDGRVKALVRGMATGLARHGSCPGERSRERS